MKRLGSFLKRHIFFTTLLVLCICALALFSRVDKTHYKNYYKKDRFYNQGDGSMYWLSRYKDTELNLSLYTDSLQDYDIITKYRIGGVSVYTTYYKTNKYTLYIFPTEEESQCSIKGVKKDYNTVTREHINYNQVFTDSNTVIGETPVREMEYGVLKHKAVDDEAGSVSVLNNYTAYSLEIKGRYYNLIFVSDDITVDEYIFTNTIVASMEYTS